MPDGTVIARGRVPHAARANIVIRGRHRDTSRATLVRSFSDRRRQNRRSAPCKITQGKIVAQLGHHLTLLVQRQELAWCCKPAPTSHRCKASKRDGFWRGGREGKTSQALALRLRTPDAGRAAAGYRWLLMA